jgi:hypothetical protein
MIVVEVTHDLAREAIVCAPLAIDGYRLQCTALKQRIVVLQCYSRHQYRRYQCCAK